MIFSSALRKTLFFSALAHLALFGAFSFSFGRRLDQANYPLVSFLGALLGPGDLAHHFTPARPGGVFNREGAFLPHSNALRQEAFSWERYPHYKPAVRLGAQAEKILPAFKETGELALPPRRNAVIMLYPSLPYHFLLYFKDRQKAHIELIFGIPKGARSHSLTLKRKISSGNLEMDLLSLRYISHYLFTQQVSLIPDSWQTVKIDLTAKDEN